MRNATAISAALVLQACLVTPLALEAQTADSLVDAAARPPRPLLQLMGTYFYCTLTSISVGCLEERFVSSDLWIFSDRSVASRVGYRTILRRTSPSVPAITLHDSSSKLSDAAFSRVVASAADAALETAVGNCNPVHRQPPLPLLIGPSDVSYTLVDWGTRSPNSVQLGSAYQDDCPPALEALFWQMLDLSTAIARTPRIVEP